MLTHCTLPDSMQIDVEVMIDVDIKQETSENNQDLGVVFSTSAYKTFNPKFSEEQQNRLHLFLDAST